MKEELIDVLDENGKAIDIVVREREDGEKLM